MLDKFNEIYSGWKNYIFKSDEVEKIAINRLKICIECDKLNRKNNRCGVCGCPISAKVRSLKSSCPLKFW